MRRFASVLIGCIFCVLLTVSVFATGGELFVDSADLVDRDGENEISERLQDVSEQYECEIVIVTVGSCGGKSPMEYADDYFDYNGYGFGEDKSGVLLLISMEEHDWWISTSGRGIEAFTDWGIEYIGEQITPYLSDGDYHGAFIEFADQCDDFLRADSEGDTYDAGNVKHTTKDYFVVVGGSFFVALVIAFISTMAMRSKLKSVKDQKAADNYIRSGSLNITGGRDIFLYHTVTKTEIPRDTSGGGGSSTHTSSSGSTHGGGGGKF